MNNVTLAKTDNSAVQLVNTPIRRKLPLYAEKIHSLRRKMVYICMKILIAEDDRDIALFYTVVLEARDHHVVSTDNGEDCLTIYRQELKGKHAELKKGERIGTAFDAVILDYKMPKINGIEVAKEIIKINPKQRIIISSAHPREALFNQ